MDVRHVDTLQELDAAVAASSERPVLLFKHSTTCSISSNAHRELERFLAADGADADVRMIIVQTARAISNEAADRLDVEHQSPQAILLREGRPVWTASHFKITAKSLSDAFASN